jgi:putative cardiolipin synthase
MRIFPCSILCLLAVLIALPLWAAESSSRSAAPLLPQLAQGIIDDHKGMSGVYVLEKGEESLLARAWLADHAQTSIDIQYFIWSTDNIGILASEALLRAAERGVTVRILVDDLLIDAPPDALLALALHPNIDIRIYNPKITVGTSRIKRISNVVTALRAVNQRMHDKTALFDGMVGIVGGRNMADEYYDYDHHYNFRDRDALVMGPVVTEMAGSFGRFWESPLAVPVEKLLAKKLKKITPERMNAIYADLRAYAEKPDNFAPEVREALRNLPQKFNGLLREMVWDEVRFLSDMPGKNDRHSGLSGGGLITTELATLLRSAKARVTIQSPYLIMPDGGLDLFRQLVRQGVEVRISTNSLASTDNLMAFSGYRKQRRSILKSGVKVYEYKPEPAIRGELMERYPKLAKNAPVFAIHAKSMVIDGALLFIGTFNLDPRSANLNTEVGILVNNPWLAAQVERNMEQDMLPENSWNAADNPDRFASAAKRRKVKLLQGLPLKPLL